MFKQCSFWGVVRPIPNMAMGAAIGLLLAVAESDNPSLALKLFNMACGAAVGLSGHWAGRFWSCDANVNQQNNNDIEQGDNLPNNQQNNYQTLN